MPKIKGGYYIKARQIKDSFIAHSAPCVRETWDYLLREANHANKKYNGFIIQRGQLFRTYKQIRDDLSWQIGCVIKRYTVNQMKHTMNVLTKHTMIVKTNHPRGVLITICNYERFQNPKNYESTNESSTNQPPNNPRINHPSIPINKNEKNKEEIYTPNLKKFVADFIKYIKETSPQKLPGNDNLFNTSLDTLEKLIRIDGFEEDYILKVIRWAKQDNFWSNQIYSLAGLRVKNQSGLTKFQNMVIRYDNSIIDDPLPKTKEQLLAEYQ